MPTQHFRLLAFALFALTATRIQAQDTVATVHQGLASYYADKFHGRRTSSGERYDKRNFTCANRHFPIGSILRVTHLENNRSVEVRVNDCGPHRADRVVDLSRAAAAEIGLIRDGLAEVRVELVSLGDGNMPCGARYPRPVIVQAPSATPSSPSSTSPSPSTSTSTPPSTSTSTSTSPPSTGFGVQVGSYGVMENAERMQSSLGSKGITNTFIARQGDLFRVMVGPFPARETAEQTRQQLQQDHSMNSVVVDLSTRR